MNTENDRGVRLHLLLEDFEKRTGEWLKTSAGRPTTEARRPATSAGPSENLPLYLLIEEYPRRTTEWWKAFASFSARDFTRLDSGGTPEGRPLRLLLEDYDPAEWPPLRARPTERFGENDARGRAGRAESAPARERPAVWSQLDEDEPALQLEVNWDEDPLSSRRREAHALSIAAHLVLIVILLLQPYVMPQRPDLADAMERQQVTLLAPPESFLRQLTQPEPNEGPVTAEFQGARELAVPLLAPQEQAQADLPGSQATLPEPSPPPKPVEETPEPEPQPPAAPEPPVPQAEPPDRSPTPAAQSPSPGELRRGTELARARRPDELPMPKAPSSSTPKLQLEDPKATSPGRRGPMQLGSLTLNARPGQVVEGAIQELSKTGGGHQAVGDDFGTGGLGGYLPPSPGNSGSNLELLSDPRGVDFRPYLIQVLSAVRRNWYAVIPESARLGLTRGRVAIQFAIVRDGAVSKLVIASSSGVQPLDRAAVAGISASNPFPPLPDEYPGSDVRLQFSFLYNIKKRQ